MQFESRVFQFAKDPERPDENQDACRIDASRGIAAIADGVASGIFSRQWARILTDAVVADDPDPGDAAGFGQWLAVQRNAWQEQIDVASLAWFQKPKLREGAFSTLLWVRLLEAGEDDPAQPATCRLRASAVGDSCLFCVRGGQVRRAFPVQRAEQLKADPVVIGSVDLGRDDLVEFDSMEETCRDGDLVVLCTDAVAEWAFRRHESGSTPDWEDYWNRTQEQWQQEVDVLRGQRQMRYDDATLVLLRICRKASGAAGEPYTTAPAAESAPPPIAVGTAENDWRERLRRFSERFVDGVSQRLSQGAGKFKQAKKSAESTIQKYRDKFRDNE